jgi:hypothetical protein
MKKFKFTVLSLLAAITVAAQDMPTPQQVFDNYITAVGGEAEISKIEDMTVNMLSSSSRGTAETEMIHQLPEYRGAMSVYAAGREMMSMKYDGEKFNRASPWGGGSEPIVGDEAQMAGMQMHPFPEMLYIKMGYTATVDSIEKVTDEDAYKVTLTKGDKNFSNFYNAKTGLKVKSVSTNSSPRGDYESTSTYEGYEAFKGSDVLFPKITKQNTATGQGAMATSSEILGIKFNKGVKDKVFRVD